MDPNSENAFPEGFFLTLYHDYSKTLMSVKKNGKFIILNIFQGVKSVKRAEAAWNYKVRGHSGLKVRLYLENDFFKLNIPISSYFSMLSLICKANSLEKMGQRSPNLHDCGSHLGFLG